MNAHDLEMPQKRILLFDRDSLSIELLVSLSDELGHVLVTIPDKEKGEQELDGGVVDLILVDVDFPRFPGFSLLEEVRKRKLDIPVVILSLHPEDVIKTLRAGADDFFRKPLNRAEVASRITDLLARDEDGGPCSDFRSDKVKILKLEREIKEISDLLKISSSVDVSGDSKKILQRLSDLAADSMLCEAASILLLNEREKTLEFVVATGDKGERLDTLSIPMGEGIAGWVATFGKPQIVNDTSKDSRFTGKVDDESGFISRQILAVPMMLENAIIGVLEVINTIDSREFGDDDVRVMNDLAGRAALVIDMTKKIEGQQNFYIQATNILVKAIEKKDMYAEGHSWRVAELCHKIGQERQLSENEMNDLYFGALLHDIGKLEIPGILLNKRDLSERERDFLRQHPVKGAKLIEQIIIWKSSVTAILYHHEHWDGSGYPFGRSGPAIPVLARIINIAEAFTTMRSPNTYKRQLTLKESILEIMRGAGKQFDPDIVKAFIRVLEKESSHKGY